MDGTELVGGRTNGRRKRQRRKAVGSAEKTTRDGRKKRCCVAGSDEDAEIGGRADDDARQWDAVVEKDDRDLVGFAGYGRPKPRRTRKKKDRVVETSSRADSTGKDEDGSSTAADWSEGVLVRRWTCWLSEMAQEGVKVSRKRERGAIAALKFQASSPSLRETATSVCLSI
jgi:hypothetical protein